jgi:hypothetical protein
MDTSEGIAEYRITVSSKGGEYVMEDIKGERELYLAIGQVRSQYPDDIMYIHQMLSTLVGVNYPAGTTTWLDK